jgi:putative alpha-1,2-mannosidase
LDALDPSYDILTIRIASSFISQEQAVLNLQQEIGGVSFDSLLAESKAAWNSVLSRANVVELGPGYTNQEQLDFYVTFYSCLYRASLFPRQLTEVDATGAIVHWSPYSTGDNVIPGPLSVDSGFWDAC